MLGKMSIVAGSRTFSASDAPGESPSRAASATLQYVVANQRRLPDAGSNAGEDMGASYIVAQYWRRNKSASRAPQGGMFATVEIISKSP